MKSKPNIFHSRLFSMKNIRDPEDKNDRWNTHIIHPLIPGGTQRFMMTHSSGRHQARLVGVHTGVQCDHCGCQPIMGIRYQCMQCPNYDLCATCEETMCSSQSNIHRPDHIFIKIR